jgi:hypothetical protein
MRRVVSERIAIVRDEVAAALRADEPLADVVAPQELAGIIGDMAKGATPISRVSPT